MTLRVWLIGGMAVAASLLVAVVLVASAPSAAVAAISVGVFLAVYVVVLALGVVILRDAQRRGRDGWLWAALFVFNPVIFGVAYLIVRNRRPQSIYRAWKPTEQAGDTSTYGLYKWWPVQAKAMLVAFAVIGVFLVWSSVVGGGGPGWPFTGFWLFALCWMAYWFMWRLVYEIELRDDVLLWRTPITSGVVKLQDIRELHPWGLVRNAEAIDLVDGRRILVLVQQGFNAFAEDLATRVPGLPIAVSQWANVADRWGGESGYRHRSE